jgi:hypothetical protein
MACDYTDLVSVLVGPDEQLFVAHRHAICAKPKFFRAACSERLSKGKEKKVTLPDLHPSVFQSYLSWVYSGQLHVSEVCSEVFDAQTSINGRHFARHFELYLLDDILDDVRLRNKAIKILVKDSTSFPSASVTSRVWDKTPENSPIRKMLVDRATLRTDRKWLTRYLARYPAEFTVQVAAKLLEVVPVKDQQCFEEKLSAYQEAIEKVV